MYDNKQQKIIDEAWSALINSPTMANRPGIYLERSFRAEVRERSAVNAEALIMRDGLRLIDNTPTVNEIAAMLSNRSQGALAILDYYQHAIEQESARVIALMREAVAAHEAAWEKLVSEIQ